MANYTEFLERLSCADPELLAGSDEYVLRCRTCPAEIPETAAQQRLVHLHLAAKRITGDETKENASAILSQITSWLEQAGLASDPTIGSSVDVSMRNRAGLWDIQLPDEVMGRLRQSGFVPEAFMTTFNDQLAASFAEELSDSLQHVTECHPGVVRCGGPIEVAGKTLCGASVETIPCINEVVLGESIVNVAVQRSIQTD